MTCPQQSSRRYTILNLYYTDPNLISCYIVISGLTGFLLNSLFDFDCCTLVSKFPIFKMYIFDEVHDYVASIGLQSCVDSF